MLNSVTSARKRDNISGVQVLTCKFYRLKPELQDNTLNAEFFEKERKVIFQGSKLIIKKLRLACCLEEDSWLSLNF